MTRDLYPQVVIDRAFDKIRARLLSDPRNDLPKSMDWCDKAKAMVSAALNTGGPGDQAPYLHGLYDLDVPIEDAVDWFLTVLHRAMHILNTKAQNAKAQKDL